MIDDLPGNGGPPPGAGVPRSAWNGQLRGLGSPQPMPSGSIGAIGATIGEGDGHLDLPTVASQTPAGRGS